MTPGARSHVSRRLRAQAALSACLDAYLDASNRMIWAGLAAASSNATPTLSALNAIAADRAMDAATTREFEHA